MEVGLINHILVPLDGSTLAECVLPHVIAIAPITHARVTLVRVMEPLQNDRGSRPVDPIEWHLQKQNSEKYLEQIAGQLKASGILGVEQAVLEGSPANSVVDFARGNNVDLIVLSTHGQSGLSGWNVSSVVQKILLRSYKSILLVRLSARLLGNDEGPLQAPVHRHGLFAAFRVRPALRHQPGAIPQVTRHPGKRHRKAADHQPLPALRSGQRTAQQVRGKEFPGRLPLSQSACVPVLTEGRQDHRPRLQRRQCHPRPARPGGGRSNADLVLLAAHGYSGERRSPPAV